MNKKILSIHKAHPPHMVGDGLPVRNFFSYSDLGRHELSPFLMLDYGFPSKFEATNKRLGVGFHPHRGFETVTFVFDGEIEHKDTAGNQGVIGPGDIQWMTAGSGVLHEEMHSEKFRKFGGQLHFLQLWVNLPADLKMKKPAYQSLLKSDIPTVLVDEGNVSIRVISGSYEGTNGPATTNTPINLWELRLKAGADFSLKLPEDYTTALVILDGDLSISGKICMKESLVIVEREGDSLQIGASANAHVMVLNGKPIDEPVVGYGPFVMNTVEQIQQALDDYRAGRFGVAQ